MSDGIVIAGGGLAAQRCCEALRARGYEGALQMVCAEPVAPYNRPPLSKQVLFGERETGELALRPADWHAEHDVELRLGLRAVRLDARARVLTVGGGRRLRYARLLVATGARPRRLRSLEGLENVHTLRDATDAVALRGALVRGARIAVVGAGLIGLEVAAAARRLGAEVTVIEALAVPLVRVLGSALGAWLAALHRDEGVELLCSASVVAVHGARGRAEELELADGRRVGCDAVVVGIGVSPDAAWLAGSGLDAAGVATDPAGRTALPGVWAAGDVALVRDPATGRLEHAGHWEAAARGGSAVAHDMLGLSPPAVSLPSFWSDQFGTRIQIAGRPGEADHIQVLDGSPPRRDFCAVLTRNGHPVAGVAVGRPRTFAALRRSLSPLPPSSRKAA